MKRIYTLLLLCSIHSFAFGQVEKELPEVEISSERFQLAYDHPEMTIIDYDFHEEGLILVIRDRSNYHLRLTDELSNTLFDISIPKKPREIFTDCFGNNHLVYDDLVYQITESSKTLALYPPVPIAFFTEHLARYSLATKDALFWQEFTDHNQSVAFLKHSNNNKYVELIHETGDTISAKSTGEFHDELMISAGQSPDRMGELNPISLAKARRIKEDFWLYEQILSQEIYCPNFLLEDSIYIFDHCKNQAVVFNSLGQLQRSFSIDYHFPDTWDKKMLTDYDSKAVYAQFVKKGRVFLKKINPVNGDIEKTHSVADHNFPEKIKIRNGYVYYIHNEMQATSLPNVYRQRLR